MKKTLLILAAFASVITGAQAATIAIGAGFGASAGVIAQTSAGVNLSSGGYYIAVGTYASAPQITDLPSFIKAIADFQEFGNATSSKDAGPTQGKIAGSITSIPADPSIFNTKEIYMIVGNGDSKATSTEFAVLRGETAWNFPGDTAAGGATTITMSSVTSFNPVGIAGTEIDTATVDGVKLLAVPEVSSSLLLGLSALGLIARRRR